ncbi:hypothetical protein DWV53_12130 [Segatella copri]|uniref:Uncharacterized protein n=1 Tax=Segatella copri TaxID=165179 RepID=A0A3R6BMJ4_9BACT|nr:hypothetical protein DWY11_14195 [Segatella copri]RGS45046.1 hypothetical protein DWX90_14730 [Segatella copri]RGW76427.1 hypothetical protein DWV53_12130 [Segatella copri]
MIAALLMGTVAHMAAQDKKEFTLEVYGGEIPNVKPAFDEEHFLGGEITKKWNTFLCNYTHTYEVEVGLSSSGTEFRKPAVFKAVERVNKYVKKSYKSQHMTKEEAIRIMSHVLDCANIICLESDTAALEEAAGDANTAEEALAFFDHIKLINV